MSKSPAAGCVLLLIAACSSTNQSATAPPATAATPDPQLASLQASMTEMLERLDVMNDRITRLEKANDERAQAQQPVERRASPRAETPAAVSAAAPQNPIHHADIAQAYRGALALYGNRDWARARAAFQQVFDGDPSGELADNALFWIGGTYYQAGDWSDAIRYYKRVVDEYGDQNKAPDAMYMLALAYEKTGDLVLARTTLQQVIARYPYSGPASSAKSELNRIKY